MAMVKAPVKTKAKTKAKGKGKGPGLKPSLLSAIFRGLKAPAPSKVQEQRQKRASRVVALRRCPTLVAIILRRGWGTRIWGWR